MPGEERKNEGAPAAIDQSNVEQFVRNIIASNGSAEAAVRVLGKDNLRLRRRNNTLTQELDGYKTRNPQGSVVLVGEDVTAWNEFKQTSDKLKASGVKITDVPKIIEERTELTNKVVQSERKSRVQTAATDLKFDAVLLEDLVTTKGLDLEKKKVTVQVDGKVEQVEKWHVRPAGDASANPVLIEESDALKPYLRVLGSTGEGGDDDEGAREDGVPVPAQGRSSGKPASVKKEVAKTIINRYATPSELRKKE